MDDERSSIEVSGQGYAASLQSVEQRHLESLRPTQVGLVIELQARGWTESEDATGIYDSRSMVQIQVIILNSSLHIHKAFGRDLNEAGV